MTARTPTKPTRELDRNASARQKAFRSRFIYGRGIPSRDNVLVKSPRRRLSRSYVRGDWGFRCPHVPLPTAPERPPSDGHGQHWARRAICNNSINASLDAFMSVGGTRATRSAFTRRPSVFECARVGRRRATKREHEKIMTTATTVTAKEIPARTRSDARRRPARTEPWR